MGSVLLVIYLMVILLLVVLILMQRNSGNALSGLGGGNGADSFLSARGKGNLLTKTTWILGFSMIALALGLDLYYKGESKKPESITDIAPLAQTAPVVPAVPTATAEPKSAPVEVQATANQEATTNAEATASEEPVTEATAE